MRRGRHYDAPTVGPPEKGVAITDDTPGLAEVAFSCISQTWGGRFHRRAPRKDPVYAMGEAYSNKRGRKSYEGGIPRYFPFNEDGGKLDVCAKQVFLDQEPAAGGIELPDTTKR